MWNYHIPFFNPFLPQYPYQWPEFHPPYPFPSPLQVPTFPPPPLFRKQDHSPSLEIVSPPTSPRKVSPPQDSIASRIAHKANSVVVHKKKDKEDSFDKKRQKKDRNLPSNICRFFICFLYQHNCPERVFGVTGPDEVAQLRNCIREVKKYVKFNQTYIRPYLIERMCRGELIGSEHASCFRAMFNRFIKVELKMMVSMMSKLRKKEKLSYFKIANKFLKQFLAKT